MRLIKWLWAIVMGMAAVMFFAALSSVFACADCSWYVALTKPQFTPGEILFSICWGMVYLLSSFTLAAMALAHVKTMQIVLALMQQALNLAYVIVFFHLHVLIAAFSIAVIQFAISAYLAITFLNGRKTRIAAGLYTPVSLWYSFLLLLSYCVLMLN